MDNGQIRYIRGPPLPFFPRTARGKAEEERRRQLGSHFTPREGSRPRLILSLLLASKMHELAPGGRMMGGDGIIGPFLGPFRDIFCSLDLFLESLGCMGPIPLSSADRDSFQIRSHTVICTQFLQLHGQIP